MALKDSLISVWELSEASGDALDAHASNDLTETGGTIDAVSGPSGLAGARDFESGDTEHFEVASNSTLQTGDIDFTLSAWVNIESLTSTMAIVGKVETSGNQREYYLLYSATSGRFRLDVSATGASFVSAVANNLGLPSTVTWYHVVGWHDSVNNQVGIAVNAGTPDTTGHTTGVLAGSSPFRIGAISVAGSPSQFWDGLIAQVAFWKRVLTSDERTELYASGNGLPYSSWDAGGGGGLSIPIAMHHRRLMGVS